MKPKAASEVPTAAQVSGGIPVPPVRLLQVMSSEDWEGFTEEWLSYYKDQGKYDAIKRYSGPGDMGLDVVAFTASNGFASPWDSYQCKQYNHALRPTDIYGEVGKIIFHSFKRTPPFNQQYRVPRRHVFVSPHGMGITVGRWIKDQDRFKEEVRSKWESHCVPKIGSGIEEPLQDELMEYLEDFDFSIFEDITAAELIAEHAKTIFHAGRFGGGLPPRGDPETPPTKPAASESLYLRKLLDAYTSQMGKPVATGATLVGHPELEEHYNRQRVLFYSAESLRNFARDRTPPKTFDLLQDDIYNGVIDICEAYYNDALERLRRTISKAGSVDVSGNALVSVTRVADKQGICHQLANDDRLTWMRSYD